MRSAVAGLIMNDAVCSSGMSSGTGQAFAAGTTAYCAQLPPAELRAKTRWPTEKPLDVGAHRVDDGDPFESGAGREMRRHTRVAAPRVEHIGRGDRAEASVPGT